MDTTYRIVRIDEQMYGCEELPGTPAPCPTRIKS